MARWRTRHRGVTGDRGAAAVEFAIVLVVLLLIIFAIIDFGRLFFAVQGMKSASREGARTAAVRADWGPTATTGTVLKAATDAGAAGASLAGGTLQVTGVQGATSLTSGNPVTTKLCTSATAGSSVVVTASTGFTWFTPAGIFASSVNSVSADTTMRCE